VGVVVGVSTDLLLLPPHSAFWSSSITFGFPSSKLQNSIGFDFILFS